MCVCVCVCVCVCTQFDTYRWMRQALGNDWQSACPATNSLWIAYLADTLLGWKMNKCSAAQKRAMRDFRPRAAAAAGCEALVGDALFSGLVTWSRDGGEEGEGSDGEGSSGDESGGEGWGSGDDCEAESDQD